MNRATSIAAIGRSQRAAHGQTRGLRPGRGLFASGAPGLVALLWTVCVALPLRAEEHQPVTIALVDSRGGTYFEPAGGRIVLRSLPFRLSIRIRNTSAASVLIRVSPEKAYALELKDQAGQTFMVKRIGATAGGEVDDDIRVDLSPGAEKIISMTITRDAWAGFPELKAGRETTFTARVVYETADRQHLYSEPCTLVFNLLP